MNRSRPRAWLPLVVFALCVVGPLALAQPGSPFPNRRGDPQRNAGGISGPDGLPVGGMPVGGEVEQKMWTCGKCKHEWAANGPTPERCPKCGTVFNEVQNADGTTTKTAAGRRNMYIGLAVVGVAIVAAVIKGVIAMSSGGSKPKKKKKKVRRPRDDDDDY